MNGKNGICLLCLCVRFEWMSLSRSLNMGLVSPPPETLPKRKMPAHQLSISRMQFNCQCSMGLYIHLFTLMGPIQIAYVRRALVSTHTHELYLLTTIFTYYATITYYIIYTHKHKHYETKYYSILFLFKLKNGRHKWFWYSVFIHSLFLYNLLLNRNLK